ncbi:MAG: hypothetical protein V2B13_10310 [Pseudomonadota bacterium]
MNFSRPAPCRPIFSGTSPRRPFVLTTVLIIFMALLGPFQGYAEEKGLREYPVPEHGVLQLDVPQSWKDEVPESTDGRPPTITFRPGDGNDFVMMITPLWEPAEEKKFDTDEKIHALIKEDWKAFSKEARESKPVVHKLSGTGSHGFYYTATDKASKKGEYKYLLRAGVKVGDLLLSVTILSHKKGSKAFKDGLHLLGEARQKND